MAELHTASRCLDRAGFVNRPTWTLSRDGLRPPPPLSGEPDEWQHGWQYHASSPVEHHHRETVIFAESDAADQAHMRSHAGPGAGVRSTKSNRVQSGTTPLPHTGARTTAPPSVGDGSTLRVRPRSGRLRKTPSSMLPFRARAVGPERSLSRVCREAGATVRTNTKLRDMNVCVPANDQWAIEVLASGLPLAPRSATRCGHHIEVCPYRVRVRTAEFIPHGRSHPHRTQ